MPSRSTHFTTSSLRWSGRCILSSWTLTRNTSSDWLEKLCHFSGCWCGWLGSAANLVLYLWILRGVIQDSGLFGLWAYKLGLAWRLNIRWSTSTGLLGGFFRATLRLVRYLHEGVGNEGRLVEVLGVLNFTLRWILSTVGTVQDLVISADLLGWSLKPTGSSLSYSIWIGSLDDSTFSSFLFRGLPSSQRIITRWFGVLIHYETTIVSSVSQTLDHFVDLLSRDSTPLVFLHIVGSESSRRFLLR